MPQGSTQSYRDANHGTLSSSALAALASLAINRSLSNTVSSPPPPQQSCSGNLTQAPNITSAPIVKYASIFPSYSLIALTFLIPEVIIHLHTFGETFGEKGTKLSEQIFHLIFAFLALGEIGLLFYLNFSKPGAHTQILDFVFIGLAALTTSLEIISSHLAKGSQRSHHLETKYHQERESALEKECNQQGHRVSLYRIACSRIQDALPRFSFFSRQPAIADSISPFDITQSNTPTERFQPSPRDLHTFRMMFFHAFGNQPPMVLEREAGQQYPSRTLGFYPRMCASRQQTMSPQPIWV